MLIFFFLFLGMVESMGMYLYFIYKPNVILICIKSPVLTLNYLLTLCMLWQTDQCSCPFAHLVSWSSNTPHFLYSSTEK